MLRRLYIDNYKCLTNFEIKTDYINLFLGANGSGKSTVFEVLRKLQSFVNGGGRVEGLFKSFDLTRWQKSAIQSFELEIDGNGGLYKYELAIEHLEERRTARVKHESLLFDRGPLLKFESGDVQLYRDDHSKGPKYPFDWSQSAIASILPRRDNTRLTWFRERMRRLIIVHINPMMMSGESDEEEPSLDAHMENYVAWYRYIYQDQGKAIRLTTALKDILEGFEYFRFVEAGEQTRVLRLVFSGNVGNNQSIEYRFDELSDGQRMLIALHTLIHFSQSEDYTVCIDEPENFAALPEIQPWLTELYELCRAGEMQALLISHHPELINYLLASPVGYWFERQSNTPSRIKRISSDNDSGLPISELIARGWLNG